MKKLISLMMTVWMLLTFAAAEPLHIGVMSGPTGMGMAKLMMDDTDTYTFEIYAAPTEATADLASGALDMLCLPTNTAANLANAKPDMIRVLAINCLGTLYVVTDADTQVASVADLAGMTLWAGVPSSTTGPILSSIFAQNSVSVNIEWEADHDAVIARMLQGEIHAAVLPEPKVTAALTKAEGWKVALNVSEAWNDVYETSLPMGCIVARCDTMTNAPDEVTVFLDAYQQSIAYINDPEHVAESADMIANAGVLPSAGVAGKALKNLGAAICYAGGDDMKNMLKAFYDVIGQPQPDDSFYYVP